jgi:hypothetical protein
MLILFPSFLKCCDESRAEMKLRLIRNKMSIVCLFANPRGVYVSVIKYTQIWIETTRAAMSLKFI